MSLPGGQPRYNAQQQITYLRAKVTFEDSGSVFVGEVPEGALILKAQSSLNVLAAFNAGSANTIDVGTSVDDDLYASALSGTSVAQVPFDEFTAANVTSEAVKLYATFNGSGAAATAGEAIVIVAFIANNDR
jgi:hypothetical protein